MNVINSTTFQPAMNPILLPQMAFSSLIIGNTLIIGGYFFIQLYSLPDMRLIKEEIKIKQEAFKLYKISERLIACGQGAGHIEIIDIVAQAVVPNSHRQFIEGDYVKDLIVSSNGRGMLACCEKGLLLISEGNLAHHFFKGEIIKCIQ